MVLVDVAVGAVVLGVVFDVVVLVVVAVVVVVLGVVFDVVVLVVAVVVVVVLGLAVVVVVVVVILGLIVAVVFGLVVVVVVVIVILGLIVVVVVVVVVLGLIVLFRIVEEFAGLIEGLGGGLRGIGSRCFSVSCVEFDQFPCSVFSGCSSRMFDVVLMGERDKDGAGSSFVLPEVMFGAVLFPIWLPILVNGNFVVLLVGRVPAGFAGAAGTLVCTSPVVPEYWSAVGSVCGSSLDSDCSL